MGVDDVQQMVWRVMLVFCFCVGGWVGVVCGCGCGVGGWVWVWVWVGGWVGVGVGVGVWVGVGVCAQGDACMCTYIGT